MANGNARDSSATSAAVVRTAPPVREKRIKVCVRLRPFTKNEAVKAGGKAAWTWHENTIYQQIFPAQIPIRRLTGDKKSGGSTTSSSVGSTHPDSATLPSSYSFDYLYPPMSTTHEVYEETVKDAITGAMDGYHSSVFLYGQTGTGKTYTMQGTKTDPGIVQLSVQDIFNHVASHPDMEFLLRFSYLEIYNERIYDLLAAGAKAEVKIYEVSRNNTNSSNSNSNSNSNNSRDSSSSGPVKDVVIKGLREEIVVTMEHVLSLVEVGNQHRHMATTESNDQSSRSHVIFRMVIESQHKRSRDRNLNAPARSATLNLIDLAGSES
uniref:Kinesin-like protein n=1 Tax=Globisporangium ultimum (strain ATCC 200006 / CBS 805.95 / DAOM BR144) TaxID=431595 RepID=K3WP33_GLOUD